jgi:hypothetical protein
MLLLRTLRKMRPRSGRLNSVAVSSKRRYLAPVRDEQLSAEAARDP